MLFWKQSLDCPVLQTGDEALIRLYLFLRKRARVYGADITVGSMPVRLRRNEFVFGRNAVGKALDLHPSRVYRKLQKLLKLGVLRLTQKLEGKFSIYQFTDRTGLDDSQFPSNKSLERCSQRNRTRKKITFKSNLNTTYRAKLSENQISIDEPFLLRNDLNKGIQRYGRQFLDWLTDQAKQKAKVNWIGLLITMLRDGRVVGEYVDQKKEIERKRKAQEVLESLRIRRLEEERRRDQEEAQRIQMIISRAQNDEEYRKHCEKMILDQIPSRMLFLKRLTLGNITPSEIMKSPKVMSLFEIS